LPHQSNEIVVEEWIKGAIVDAERTSIDYLDFGEACLCKFLDEVTLRQGAGHSPGPRGWVSQDFRRQITLVHREV
jgi:hypothetical protein